MKEYSTFKAQLERDQQILDDLDSITEENWEDLTEGQQEDMVRDARTWGNFLNGLKHRYFEW